MSLGKLLRGTANYVLRPVRLEVVKRRDSLAGLSMQGALERARDHGFNVGTIVDIGASDGKWSNLAMRFFPRAHVLAFEPLEERRASLEAFRRGHPRFEFILAAAGGREGSASYLVADDLDGSGLCEGENAGRSVPVTTIDAEIQRRDLPAPYLLKFDTHGFELPILAGAKETLRETSLIVMEVYNFRLNDHSLRFHEMCGHLESLGFRCFDLADPLLRVKDHALWQFDLFFSRHDAPLFACAQYA